MGCVHHTYLTLTLKKTKTKKGRGSDSYEDRHGFDECKIGEGFISLGPDVFFLCVASDQCCIIVDPIRFAQVKTKSCMLLLNVLFLSHFASSVPPR